jgi:putative ABC transport system permease protein
VLDRVVSDLRLASRSLMRDRAFSSAAIATLALGVGAITALSAIVAGVLLAPLPYKDPERLVAVLHGASVSSPVSPADFLDLRQSARSFAGMAAAQSWGANLAADGRTERVAALQVSGTLFEVLGTSPHLGRAIAETDVASESRVVVLAHRLWTRRFGADPAVIGRSVRINGEAYQVIGVMPPAFRFAPFWQTRAEAWVPLSLTSRATDREGRSLRVFARLRDGVTLEAARAEVQAINARLAADWPASNTGLTLGVERLSDKATGSVRRLLLAIFGLATGLLVAAVVNLAMLVLSRTTGRQAEWAIRAALGASRQRLLSGAVIEGLLVALGGAIGGFLCAVAGTRVLARMLPPDSLPPHAVIAVPPAALAGAIALSSMAALAATIFTAWTAAGHAGATAIRPARTATANRALSRARRTLVGVEVALAFALAATALLFGRTVSTLQDIDPGFDADGLTAVSVSLDGAGVSTAEARTVFFSDVVARVAALPGVASVSAINHLPLAGDLWTLGYAVEGRPPARPGERPGAAYRVVLPGYFKTMGQALVAGRDFTAADREGSLAVVIVNRRLADRQWPQGALGQRLIFEGATLTVIGVVGAVAQSTLVDPIGDEMYLPLAQRPLGSATRSPMTLVVRTAREGSVLPSMASAVWAVNRGAAVYDGTTMDDVMADEIWRQRLSASVGGIFAGVALLLAAVGITGIVRYAVTARWREFGVRLALGATRTHVIWLALADAVLPLAFGLGAGLVTLLAATRLIETLLVGVSPRDPVTLTGAALVLIVVALLAAWRPAARAAGVDPAMALRN